MKTRDRFLQVLAFEKPHDRLPCVEWAAWWDKTIDRWLGEGLPPSCDMRQPGGFKVSLEAFNLDPMHCIQAPPIGPNAPQPQSHGAGIIQSSEGYDHVQEHLFLEEAIDALCRDAEALRIAHERGDCIIRLWLDGFFWFPRSLLGIERHLFSFYDQPQLLSRMQEDLASFHRRTLGRLLEIVTPDMVAFAEDMSYNQGPMLSKELYDAFIAPGYRELLPLLQAKGIKVFVDTDGDVQPLIPWLVESGIDGIFPLERQSNVDAAKIRADYPKLLMLGGYDKRVMSRGEKAMRAEFERLLPVMRSGGFIPSVDHQTPPDVSLSDYRLYARLLHEYAAQAVR